MKSPYRAADSELEKQLTEARRSMYQLMEKVEQLWAHLPEKFKFSAKCKHAQVSLSENELRATTNHLTGCHGIATI